MKTWNKKRKPKHWTKPTWKEKYISWGKFMPYHLYTRGIKDKYKKDFDFYLNNIPRYKFLLKSKKEKQL